MDRRAFLRLGLGGAAALAGPGAIVRTAAGAQPAPGPFGHGVASGDPLPDRVVLWTRVTPSVDATPGSGVGTPTAVSWEVARDAAFTDVVASGEVVASAASDHTVKVDAAGLPASSELWYRFRALGAVSPVGRTRTAPADTAAVDRLRLGVVSCSNYEGGFFSAYRHLAERDDLDLVLHLGDYVYEYGVGAYGPGPAIGREHDPVTEMVTLEDYRRRHALYKTDADLAALHQRYAWVTTIDDHEVTDNSWADGAVNHQPAEGDYAARRAAAFQAYREWMPVRTDGTTNLVQRSLSFGTLVELLVLDERSHRSKQVEGAYGEIFVTDPAVADPDRTMLGMQQRQWLEQRLGTSPATWKVLANPVMFAPLVLADVPDLPEAGPALQQLLDAAGIEPPIVLNGDQWDGYRAEQAALTRAFGDSGGVVVLTGDIHSSWAAEIPADPGAYLPGVGGVSNAVEFVTPAVTSDSFSAAIASIGAPGAEELSAALPALVTTAGPWFKYVDPDRHGYGVLEVTADAAHFDWWYISDRTDPQATATVGPSWRTPAGTNRLQPAGPLGARPDRGTGVLAPAPVGQPAPRAAQPTDATSGRSRQALPATGGAVTALPVAAAAVAGALVARRTAVAGATGATPSPARASDDLRADDRPASDSSVTRNVHPRPQDDT